VLISYIVRRSASDSGTVTITGVFYGGQDYETILGDDDES